MEISPFVANISFFPNTNMKADKGKTVNKKTSIMVKRFTPKEDEIIKAAIKEAGEDHLNLPSLVKKT